VSYDFVVWAGEQPVSRKAALSTFEALSESYLDGPESTGPWPPIRAFITDLLSEWPDIAEGVASPWADSPLLNNASGPILYLGITSGMEGEVGPVAATLAERHGLVCFDPQLGAVVTRGPAGAARPSRRDLERAFRARAQERLAEGGWLRRKHGIHTIDLGDGFFGWLGLNTFSSDGLGVNPVIGMCFQPALRLYWQIRRVCEGAESAPGSADVWIPQVAWPLRYVRPDGVGPYLQMSLMSDIEPQVDQLTESLARWGMPFIQSFASVNELLEALRRGRPMVQDRPEFLPCVLAALGQNEQARTAMDHAIAKLGDADNPFAAALRAFADALHDHLTD
jgi:hypothetical protein